MSEPITIRVPAETMRRWLGRLEGVSGVCKDHGCMNTAYEIDKVINDIIRIGGNAVKTEINYAMDHQDGRKG